PTSLAVGDLNGDGRLDIVVTSYIVIGGTDNVNQYDSLDVLLGNGDGTFQIRNWVQSFDGGGDMPHVALGDVNGDGRLDVLSTHYRALFISLGIGDGSFQPGRDVGPGPGALAVADLNADGHADVVVAASILFGNAAGTLQWTRLDVSGIFNLSVAVADFNRDGVPDPAVADPGYYDDQTGTFVGASRSVFLGYGDGSFSAA